MAQDEVKILKQKGNSAFKLNQLEEALKFYSEAIELSTDSETLAILYSNCAQAYLNKKQYSEALESAEKSLKHDPENMKSILRRGVSNFELGNKKEAAEDLRCILAFESDNSTACSLMKRIIPPTKMNPQFANTFTRHYFRKVSMINNDEFYIRIFRAVIRSMWLSKKFIPILRSITSFSKLCYNPVYYSHAMSLPSWFVTKRMRVDLKADEVLMLLSNDLLEFVLNVIRPELEITISTVQCAQHFETLYDFFGVHYARETYPPRLRKDSNEPRIIESASNILTCLPYNFEILKFKDPSFPKINSLIFRGEELVSMDFLKLWKQRQWGIKKIIVKGMPPKMRNFELFNGTISDKVTQIQFPFADEEDFNFQRQAATTKKNLKTMKSVFPNLSEVVGTYKMVFLMEEFSFVMNAKLKTFISNLATQISTKVKFSWCNKIKIMFDLLGLYEPGETEIKLNIPMVKRIVNECRQEIPSLKYIALRGPSQVTFDCYPGSITAAMIEMGTENMDFQINFRVLENQ